MSTLDPQTEITLRQGFKYMNKFMVLLWQFGLGRFINLFPKWGGRIMVLAHTGRRSGTQRFTPVNYFEANGDIYCTAGFGSVADWYKNILSNPNVEVWMPDGYWAGVAEDISKDEDRLKIMRQVLINSGFAAPLFGINPNNISEQALQNATNTYRLIRIRKTEARTGNNGPGSLSWIWPITTVLLLLALLRRRRD
jgi:deazaflavin-dependent oxidoreductase (nitroreductase family)